VNRLQVLGTPGKLALLTSLYVSQGLPFGFFTQALPVLMRQQGLSLPAIGMTALLALPWALKFLWAPLIDRHGSSRFGRRRSWIIPLQFMAAAAMAGVSGINPSTELPLVLAAVLVANLLAATQDIATDALAIDMLNHEERGLGNGIQVAGYRVGMIVGGSLLLVQYERLGWSMTFLTMSGLLCLATTPFSSMPSPLHATE